MCPQEAVSPGRKLLGFLKGIIKIGIVVGVFVLLVSLVFKGSIKPDHHGIKALEEGHPIVGAWLGAWPSDENELLEKFNKDAGIRLDLVDVFLDWYTPFHNVSSTVENIARHGAVPMLTWEAQGITTRQILEGTYEVTLRDDRRVNLQDYLNEFAEGTCQVAKDTQQPVFVRVLHEMNGDWFAWGIGFEDRNGKRPNDEQTYVAAWRHIHDAFSDRCGDMVKFVWAINHFSKGDGTSFTAGFPGERYVDYLGIDGYNWGDNAFWGWQSFDVLFHEPYCALVGMSSLPILIPESASTEKGGSKPVWIKDALGKVLYDKYPQVEGYIWFNDAKYEVEIQGKMDWPISSSQESTDAFREMAQGIQGLRDGKRPAGGDDVGPANC